MTIFNRIGSGVLTNFKPILISIVTVIVTAPIAWYVPKFLEKQEIEINLQELALSSGRYVYLFDITNIGKSPIQDINLSVLAKGKIYASIFDIGPTTHDPYYRLDKSPFNGKIEINENDTVTTVNYPLDSGSQNASKELLKNRVRDAIGFNNSIWYPLNITPFNLATNKTLHASIIMDSQIDGDHIRCDPNPELCSVRTIKSIPNESFERILSAMSIQNGGISNKIFGSGLGVSNNMIRGSAIADAKHKAILDFYKDITEKLYGVNVKSMIKHYSESSTNSANSFYQDVVAVESQGIIDRASAIIYHEDSTKLKTGEIVYEVKGYYEFPQDIDIKQPQTISSGFALPTTPIELEGAKPYWVDNPVFEDDNIALSSVGESDSGLPYPLAKRIAATRALAELARSTRTTVQTMVKPYLHGTKAEKKQDEIIVGVSKQIAVETLAGNTIVAYYKQDDGIVYALAVIPKSIVANRTLADIGKSIGDKSESINRDKSISDNRKHGEQSKENR